MPRAHGQDTTGAAWDECDTEPLGRDEIARRARKARKPTPRQPRPQATSSMAQNCVASTGEVVPPIVYSRNSVPQARYRAASGRPGHDWDPSLSPAVIGRPKHDPRRAYARALGIGTVIGLVVAVFVAWAMGGYSGMLSRRGSVSIELAEESLGSDPWPGEKPPISFALLYDGELAVDRMALLGDIREMKDPEGALGIFSWSTVPYLIGEGRQSDCHGLLDLVDGIYSDYPELSVYTNGQCVSAAVIGARYMLPEAKADDPDENAEELEAVSERLDLVAAECAEAAGANNEEYVRQAFRAVAGNCDYADKKSDSPHANDIYGALIEGESRCYGGSAAMKALLDRRGIPSFMASGKIYGDPSRLHAWNVLRLGDRWYACDVTGAMGMDAEKDDIFYWSCLQPLEGYLKAQDILMDDEDRELMAAYEKMVAGDAGREFHAVPGIAVTTGDAPEA